MEGLLLFFFTAKRSVQGGEINWICSSSIVLMKGDVADNVSNSNVDSKLIVSDWIEQVTTGDISCHKHFFFSL